MADRPESLESVGRVSNGRQPRLMSCDECPCWTRSPLFLSLFPSRFLSSRTFLSSFLVSLRSPRSAHAGFFSFIRILHLAAPTLSNFSSIFSFRCIIDRKVSFAAAWQVSSGFAFGETGAGASSLKDTKLRKNPLPSIDECSSNVLAFQRAGTLKAIENQTRYFGSKIHDREWSRSRYTWKVIR